MKSLIRTILEEIKDKQELRKNNREYKEYFDTYIGLLNDYIGKKVSRSQIANTTIYSVKVKEDSREEALIDAAKFIVNKVSEGFI